MRLYYQSCITLYITRVVLPCILPELYHPVYYQSCITLYITRVVLPCILPELCYPVYYQSCVTLYITRVVLPCMLYYPACCSMQELIPMQGPV